MSREPFHQIYLSVKDIPQDWDNLGTNIFLKSTYLKAQEEALPHNIKIFYVGYFVNNTLVGKSIFQRISLQKDQIFRNEQNLIQRTFGSLLNTTLLCVGNIKLTGENAFEFSHHLSFKDLTKPIKASIKNVKTLSGQQGKRIDMVLIKDYYLENAQTIKTELKAYQQFSVQPNMVINIRPHWHSFKDYLADMRTKYRTRAKRAFKKNEAVVYKELNLEEILANQEKIYALYLNVYNNVDFSAYQLPPNYFSAMKKYMQKDFKFFAGFLDDEMVCFYSLIHNKHVLETGFLGYNMTLQQSMQLYLNMLYKIVGYGIEKRYDQIILSRSALEIKSSVGAEAVASYGFLKHENKLLNATLKLLFKQFYKEEKWTPRSPFKS